jgi:hypothetical protein
MSVKCQIQFPNGDQKSEVELDFNISGNARPQVVCNNQIGYLEHARGDKVYHDAKCTSLWFIIRKTG